MRRTKLLATLGPATASPAAIRGLIQAGADGFRINFAHGTEESQQSIMVNAVRSMRSAHRELALLGDLEGPKIRLGLMEGGSVSITSGQPWTLDSSSIPGTRERAGVSPPTVLKGVGAGSALLVGDGSIRLIVERARGGALEARVSRGGTVASRAGLHVPGAHLRAKILGPKDRADLRRAVEGGVDYLGLSFVRTAEDVDLARRTADRVPGGDQVGLIAKIERAEALANATEILSRADGIMVARGDLGIEVPLERLALEQKSLIRLARSAGKLSIVATQMLLSMVSSPRPTRAEATDVANAVLDGADALMLSEESAIGAYPDEAVRWLARIAETTEPSLPARSEEPPGASTVVPLELAVARAATKLAADVHASTIVTPTHSGRTPAWVSSLRPPSPIVALSAREHIRRRLALYWGVLARPGRSHLTLEELGAAARAVVRRGAGAPRPIVVTAGYPVSGSPTNLVTVLPGHGPTNPRP